MNTINSVKNSSFFGSIVYDLLEFTPSGQYLKLRNIQETVILRKNICGHVRKALQSLYLVHASPGDV